MDAQLAVVASHGCDVLAMQHVRLNLATLRNTTSAWRRSS
jgi:hypothetical protein